VTSLSAGTTFLLGSLLVVAGVLKLARPLAFAHAVYRLLPERADWAARVASRAAVTIGTAEALVGGGLVAGPWLPAGPRLAFTLAGAALYSGFVGIVGVAVRRGTSCGCFSSLSDSSSGGGELGRAVILAFLAYGLVVSEYVDAPVRGWQWSGLLWVPVLVTGLGLAMVVGSRLVPPRSGTLLGGAGRSARELSSTLLGRITSRKESVSLPRPARLTEGERAGLISATRSSPTWIAFEEWLGGGATVSWEETDVRRAMVGMGDGPAVPCMTLTPAIGPAASIVVSVPLVAGRPGDCVVLGTVNGTLVTALASRVVVSSSRDRPT